MQIQPLYLCNELLLSLTINFVKSIDHENQIRLTVLISCKVTKARNTAIEKFVGAILLYSIADCQQAFRGNIQCIIHLPACIKQHCAFTHAAICK